MKISLALIVFLLSSGIADRQIGNNPEAVIQRMIDQGSLEGHDQKVLGTIGDAAAVILTKVLAGKTPSTGEIDTSLLILNMAFADPSMVEVPSDRKPRTALFVLQAFGHSAPDTALRKRIVETREYIQARYIASLKDSPSE